MLGREAGSVGWWDFAPPRLSVAEAALGSNRKLLVHSFRLFFGDSLRLLEEHLQVLGDGRQVFVQGRRDQVISADEVFFEALVDIVLCLGIAEDLTRRGHVALALLSLAHFIFGYPLDGVLSTNFSSDLLRRDCAIGLGSAVLLELLGFADGGLESAV